MRYDFFVKGSLVEVMIWDYTEDGMLNYFILIAEKYELRCNVIVI
jgi:hypothetical protein